MRMKRLMSCLLLMSCCGCLSVCRFCKLAGDTRREWSEERQEWVRVKVNWAEDPDFLAQFGLYPTLKMRWQMVRLSCHWAPKRSWAGQHIGIPFALLAITPGMVVDTVVDTVALPWDWKYRNNVPRDMCAPLDEERAYRSLCVVCGATSDGEFARCLHNDNRNTADWRKYYGVCPRCVDAAKGRGYYFED